MERKDGQSKEMTAAVENYRKTLRQALISHAIIPDKLRKGMLSAALKFHHTAGITLPIGNDLNSLFGTANTLKPFRLQDLSADADILSIKGTADEMVQPGTRSFGQTMIEYCFSIGTSDILRMYPSQNRGNKLSPGVIKDLTKILKFISTHPESKVEIAKKAFDFQN